MNDDTKALLAAIADAAHDLDGLESGALLKKAADAIVDMEAQLKAVQTACDDCAVMIAQKNSELSLTAQARDVLRVINDQQNAEIAALREDKKLLDWAFERLACIGWSIHHTPYCQLVSGLEAYHGNTVREAIAAAKKDNP